jgi:hypothetical protein
MVMREAKDTIKVVTATPKLLQKTTRMWAIDPAPAGGDVGAWAQDKIDMFEANLKGYIGEN